MKTYVQAMLWQIWRGWRWGIVAGAAYLLGSAVMAHLLPGILVAAKMGAGELAVAGRYLAIPCAFVVIQLMAIFSRLSGDVKLTGYPPQSFILPVRTHALVAWPMIWGCLSVAVVWLIVAELVLRPTGHAAPLAWPACALAAALSLFQAVTWVPLVPPWLGIFVAIPAFLLLALQAVMIGVLKVPEPLATAAFAIWLPPLYCASRHAVAMSRRGDALEWSGWYRIVAWAADRWRPAERPFPSARSAQLWFECRTFAWKLPLFTVLLCPYFAILIVVSDPSDVRGAWAIGATLLLMPAMLAAFLSASAGDPVFPFLAVRPLSTAAHVRSKLEMSAISALAAFVPFVLVLPLLVLRQVVWDSIVQTTQALGGVKFAVILVLGGTLPLALVWRGLVQNLWLGLAGRVWLMNAMPLAMAALMGIGTLIGVWVWFHPDLHPLVRSAAPWALRGLLAAKLFAAAAVLYRLYRSGLASPAAIALMAATWGAVVAGLCLAVFWLAPRQVLPVALVVSIIVLAVPFARIASAPLALQWNRHR